MVETEGERVPCQSCAELIQPAAKICPHCGRRVGGYDDKGRRKLTRTQSISGVAIGLVLALAIALFAWHRVEENNDRHAKQDVCEFVRDNGIPPAEGDDCP